MENRGFISAIFGALCFLKLISLINGQAPSLDWQFDPYSTDQWFKQKQDHYDAGNVQYWPQRYVTSYRFYRLGGPVFLYLTGPGPELALDDIETGAIAAYAEEQGAFVIGLEHRYYGKSRPTTDISTENLKFLTIPQTIEDIATFVRSWRARDEFRHAKWVVFGASYLGSVSTWFADKHPELIDAFVASSAPLELRYEIPEFLQNVGDILNKTDPKCYESVAEGITCLENIISEQGCEGYTLADAKDKFNFCAELDTSNGLDITGVFAEIFSTVNAVVMYHDPDPESFPDTNLDRFCKHVTSEKGNKTAMEKLGDKVKEINKHREVPCAEFRFQTTVDFLNTKEWDSPAAKEGYRQLQFQLCNELGWTVASANISQPFGTYLSSFLHSEICQSLFGLTETEMRLKVLKSNTDLKGKNLNTKCGIFVNGDHDPWYSFGISTAEEAGICNRAILIEGGSHGRDVDDFTHNPSYPPQVKEAQLKISKYLDLWLKTGKCCEEDTAESRKVITTYTRSTRAPNSGEYFSSNNGLRQPNVHIKPHGVPVGPGEKMVASPTSLPYQVSTTDVLSVSPRIPVAGHVQENYDPNMYRDPRNAEFRRYRVVKLLRHRPSFAPLTYERTAPPSMEQFEADFPEHRIRVEGRVERVFKNGTRMNSTELSTATQISSPTYGTERPRTPAVGQDIPDFKNNRFKYIVKQVFKDTAEEAQLNGASNQSTEENAKKSQEKPLEVGQMWRSSKVSHSPKNTTKLQQSLEKVDSQSIKHKAGLKGSPKPEDDQDDDSSNSDSTSSEEPEGTDSKQVRKRDSEEKDVSSGSSESDSSSSSSTSSSEESASSTTSKGLSPSALEEDLTDDVAAGVNDTKNKTKSNSKVEESKRDNNDNEDDSEEDDEDYDEEEDDSDYYDDEYDDEDDDEDEDSNEVNGNGKATLVKPPAHWNHPRSKLSTEFSSGEGSFPKKLREKISEKIMSSSEEIPDNQNSKEKTKTGKSTLKSKDSSEASNSDSSSSSQSEEDYSEEGFNHSLEPSGSSPGKVYRKKQLAPIVKAVEQEPSTVINVEISGSYPRRRRLQKKLSTTTVEPTSNTEVELVEVTRKPRRKHHRRRRPTTQRTTSTSSETVTSEPTTESTTETTSTKPGRDDPTNSYVAWNRRKLPVPVKPVQEETPEIVNLDDNSNSGPSGDLQLPAPPTDSNQNDVMYIIIGDIPNEDGDNVVDDGGLPSKDSLFNFIQKLVTRHSSGIFAKQSNPLSYLPPNPQTTTTTATTTTPRPAPGPSYPVNLGEVSRYLLVRPVQVSLGKQHVVHAHDLKNDSLLDLMTMEESPLGLSKDVLRRPYPYPSQASKRQNEGRAGDYRFRSPFHREHFEKLLSVDAQGRDSDREDYSDYRQSHHNSMRRLDEILDPSWRSIRGISQFGPVAPPQRSSSDGLLGLSAADTMWVNDGVPFLPRNNRQGFARRNFEHASAN